MDDLTVVSVLSGNRFPCDEPWLADAAVTGSADLPLSLDQPSPPAQRPGAPRLRLQQADRDALHDSRRAVERGHFTRVSGFESLNPPVGDAAPPLDDAGTPSHRTGVRLRPTLRRQVP
jgi:hypothetical protein